MFVIMSGMFITFSDLALFTKWHDFYFCPYRWCDKMNIVNFSFDPEIHLLAE
jgi:hypothetical protein